MDNPEFRKYQNKLKLLERFSPGSASAGEEKGVPGPGMAFMSSVVELEEPNETVELTETTREIIRTEINKISKSLDTLYLRQEDEQLLQNMMNFYLDGTFVKDLGFPHKLGILLYGEPGTGKSTCIKSVASYMNKDVYYMNLSGIATNSELKAMFDKVAEQQNGGIIVFKDIDAMTPVVHRRESSSVAGDETLSAILDKKEDTLNLSYLLNMLDGTLCRSDTVFIITTNHLEKLDPALIRTGRIDVSIELKRCDHYQIGKIYHKIMGKELAPEYLAQIPEYRYRPVDVISILISARFGGLSAEQILAKLGCGGSGSV